METGRNWATILYPEHYASVEELIDKISDLHTESYLSPLHISVGKKPHYHLFICFDGKKSFSQVKAIFDSIDGVGCEFVHSKRSYARYLCHLDEQNKEKYDPYDVIVFGGGDYNQFIVDDCGKYENLASMLDFLTENRFSFSEFLLYCRQNNLTWFRYLCDNSFIIRDFITTRSKNND